MTDKDIDDIDYENLNDLPLSNHIEWDHYVQKDVAAKDDVPSSIESLVV